MNNNLNYRKGTVEDLESLRRLGLSAYGKYKETLGEEWKKMEAGVGSKETYLALLKIAKCFVCEESKELVGMIFLVRSGNPAYVFEAEWTYIRLLGIAPGFEGRGIGKALTKKCIDYARASGEKTIALHTSEYQDPARFIYESMGFKKVRELDPNLGKIYLLYKLTL